MVLHTLLMRIFRYLYEISDYTSSSKVVGIALNACEDDDTLLYAHLQNTAGACYMEENDLPRSREHMENVLEIRQRLLKASDPEVAISFANLGNVESAEGNYDKALDLFQRAARIYTELGDSQVLFLALSWIQIGRVYFLQGLLDDAYKEFMRSENLLLRTGGPNKHYLAQYVFRLLDGSIVCWC